jgi:hypothetical protein
MLMNIELLALLSIILMLKSVPSHLIAITAVGLLFFAIVLIFLLSAIEDGWKDSLRNTLSAILIAIVKSAPLLALLVVGLGIAFLFLHIII